MMNSLRRVPKATPPDSSAYRWRYRSGITEYSPNVSVVVRVLFGNSSPMGMVMVYVTTYWPLWLGRLNVPTSTKALSLEAMDAGAPVALKRMIRSD